MEVNAILCTRIDFTEIFVTSLDFADVKSTFNMSQGMTYRTHYAFQLLSFRFISDETIQHQNKSVCLILGVGVCFIFLLHKIVVYRHFSYFQYGIQNDHHRSRDYFYYHWFKCKFYI